MYLGARPSRGARARACAGACARGPPHPVGVRQHEQSRKHYPSYTGPSKNIRRTPTNEPRTKFHLIERMEFRSWFVRSFVGIRPFFFLYCTTVQFCCTCAVDKKRKSGPRAQKGPRATGTTRGTHPRAPQGREQRGTVLRTKLTAPEPRIVRAPELVDCEEQCCYIRLISQV